MQTSTNQILNPQVAVWANTKKPKLYASFAEDNQSVKAAQRLRAEVFSAEYGVNFPTGFDIDEYDKYCKHLNVYDVSTGMVVATTRLLSDENIKHTGGFYSEKEFDLTRVKKISGRKLEVGRTCVHPDYRSGSAITVLWMALADYYLSNNYRYLIGCASIGLSDGGSNFAAIMKQLNQDHFLQEEHQVFSKKMVNVSDFQESDSVVLPPLLKAYLRMGCKVSQDVFWDADFDCVDIFIFFDREVASGRYVQKFMKAS